MDAPSIRMVLLTSPQEGELGRKFLVGPIAVAFNKEFTAFSPNSTTVLIYPNNITWNSIKDIFYDSSVTKLIMKPTMALTNFLKKSPYNNVEHLSTYLNQRGESRSIIDLKHEITNKDEILSLDERAGAVALAMSHYRELADNAIKKPKKSKKSRFNQKRDCYLLYLTAYNDILSRYGPLKYIDLIARVRKYPFLCRTKMTPGFALEGLIKVGALIINVSTTMISIPDQIP